MNQPPDPHTPAMPPRDLDAEMAVLSSAILDPNSLFEVSDFLTADMFEGSRNAPMYKALNELNSEGENLDYVTINARLRKNGDLESVGDGYFFELLALSVTSVNIGEYGRIVAGMHSRRKAIRSSGKIATAAYDMETEETAIGELMTNEAIAFNGGGREKFLHDSADVAQSILSKSERASNGEIVTKIYETGIAVFDRIGCLIAGLLIIICGRPGSGKTTLCLNLIFGLAEQRHVLFVSQEMSEEQLVERMICSLARLELWQIRSGDIPDDKWSDYHHAVQVLSDRSRFTILYAENIDTVWGTAARLKAQNGEAPIIFIDYLELMIPEEDKEQIQNASTKLKRMARRLDTPVVLVRQLTRGVESREDKRPRASDLRYGGEQQADGIIACYRDEYYHPDTTEEEGVMRLGRLKWKYGETGWKDSAVYCDMKYSQVSNVQYQQVF